MARWFAFRCACVAAIVLLGGIWADSARHAAVATAAENPAYTISEPDYFLYVPPNAGLAPQRKHKHKRHKHKHHRHHRH